MISKFPTTEEPSFHIYIQTSQNSSYFSLLSEQKSIQKYSTLCKNTTSLLPTILISTRITRKKSDGVPSNITNRGKATKHYMREVSRRLYEVNYLFYGIIKSITSIFMRTNYTLMRNLLCSHLKSLNTSPRLPPKINNFYDTENCTKLLKNLSSS